MSTASHYTRDLSALLEATEATAGDEAVSLDAVVDRMIGLLRDVKQARQRVFLVGNGGSASVAGHLQMDLVNALGVQALCFHDIPTLTALSNDHGYDTAFDRNLDLWARQGDVLVAISSSGRSPNVVAAADRVRERGGQVVTFTGFDADNPLRARGHLNLYVPSHAYGLVETVHACLAHLWTDLALEALGARS